MNGNRNTESRYTRSSSTEKTEVKYTYTSYTPNIRSRTEYDIQTHSHTQRAERERTSGGASKKESNAQAPNHHRHHFAIIISSSLFRLYRNQCTDIFRRIELAAPNSLKCSSIHSFGANTTNSTHFHRFSTRHTKIQFSFC